MPRSSFRLAPIALALLCAAGAALAQGGAIANPPQVRPEVDKAYTDSDAPRNQFLRLNVTSSE